MNNKIVLGLFTGIVIFFASCSRGEVWHTDGGAVWGTVYTVKYLGDRELGDSVVATMRQVELSLSCFDKASTVSRINAGETDSVDAMFAHVFGESRRLSELTHGAFDPTVAPLVNLWGFGFREYGDNFIPDEAALDSALAMVGIGECGIKDGRVMRKAQGTQFDFSAIAKGYGVDCVAEMLRRNGVENYMVEIGGEVRAGGVNDRGEEWRIQIDDPTGGADEHRRLCVVPLKDCAMATSGNYRNFRRLADGTLVAHTISPQTGRPVQTRTLSVTVIAPDCLTADALATGFVALPAEEAMKIAKSLKNVSALFVTAPKTSGGKPEIRTSSARFPQAICR